MRSARIESQVSCENCGTFLSDVRGVLTCTECGLVYEPVALPPRYIPEDKIPATAPYVEGSSTYPRGSFFTDHQGKLLKEQKQKHYRRLKKINAPRQNSKTRNLYVIDLTCSKLGLPNDVRQAARRYFVKALKQVESNGNEWINRVTLSSVCLYQALQDLEVSTISWKDICDFYHAEGHGLSNSDLSKNVNRFPSLFSLTGRSPLDLVPTLIHKLNFSMSLKTELEKTTLKVVRMVTKSIKFMGKNPRVIVASSIYFAASLRDIQVTQKALSKACNVTEMSIRKRCKEIKAFFGACAELKNNQGVGRL